MPSGDVAMPCAHALSRTPGQRTQYPVPRRETTHGVATEVWRFVSPLCISLPASINWVCSSTLGPRDPIALASPQAMRDDNTNQVSECVVVGMYRFSPGTT